jgi:rhamnose utilization protein RhaD (predicted bifunctional aldolase and dehydrogenase)/NAD(P)-dependent dehydrogenase (short-subunit alcohol dehydrogenase family)
MSEFDCLKQLKAYSNQLGSDPDYVLAGGGNTSCKIKDELYIKASGTSLADITEEQFVVMDKKLLQSLWTKQYPTDDELREKEVLKDVMDARRSDQGSKRPSVEVLLHDIFPQRFVVHTHPAIVNAITCSSDGGKAIKKLFGDKAIWIDEIKPGFLLASAVKLKVNEYTSRMSAPPKLLFMQNHGLLAAADSIEEIVSLHDYVFGVIKQNIKIFPDFSSVEFDAERASFIAPALRMMLMQNNSSIVIHRNNKEISSLVNDEESFNPLSLPFSPDHIVYCRHKLLFVKARRDLDEQYKAIAAAIANYKDEHGFLPKIIAIEKLGIFACGQSRKEASDALDLFMDAVKISFYSNSFGGPRYMSNELISFIVTWEVESYRQKVAVKTSSGKRVNEKIAVITGSAQGFGKGLAEEMAKEGANVVLADINPEQAHKNSLALCDRYGRGKSFALKADVGNEADVKAMFIKSVLEYGGIDVFISNAGILRAGGLEEMDAQTFEAVTKINYTAYFLGVKYASKYMKIQSRFNKDYFMDIIQINSKSGISGSNKNFAYAGGKFGGIGLTQSFALELAEYRIKVNSICPGNFFDGPLWSDPEKGLFVQYLKAGKIPGAKTFEDVKRYYESLVPLKRGCEMLDVARAVFYAIEQLYETGQAIPVTGGQIMLK